MHARRGRVEQKIDDQCRPSGLVRGAEPGPVVAVEVLEEQQVVPGGVVLEPGRSTEDGPVAVGGAEEDRGEAVGEVLRDLEQRELLAGAGRVLDGEVGADVLVEPGQRPDHQVVHRHPDRAPPVGVAAVHGRGRLGRFVVDGVADAVDRHGVGATVVALRQRSQAVGRQERLLVEELGESRCAAGRGVTTLTSSSAVRSIATEPTERFELRRRRPARARRIRRTRRRSAARRWSSAGDRSVTAEKSGTAPPMVSTSTRSDPSGFPPGRRRSRGRDRTDPRCSRPG